MDNFHVRTAAARREDWNLQQAPAMLDFPFQRNFSVKDHGRLAWGVVPVEMEDKWFAFLEDDIMYWYRSWTGFLVYRLELSPSEDGHGWVVSKAEVCAESDKYQRRDDQRDIEILNLLLDHTIAGKFT